MGFLKKLFGDYSTKEIKRIRPLCDKVLSLESEFAKLTDEQLQAKTPEFKQRLANGETLDDILPEAFAACREAAKHAKHRRTRYRRVFIMYVSVYLRSRRMIQRLQRLVYDLLLFCLSLLHGLPPLNKI